MVLAQLLICMGLFTSTSVNATSVQANLHNNIRLAHVQALNLAQTSQDDDMLALIQDEQTEEPAAEQQVEVADEQTAEQPAAEEQVAAQTEEQNATTEAPEV
jgi:hypothetical protein